MFLNPPFQEEIGCLRTRLCRTRYAIGRAKRKCRPHAQKFWRISRQWEQSIKLSVGSSKGRTLNNPTGCTPRKPALVQRDVCSMFCEGFWMFGALYCSSGLIGPSDKLRISSGWGNILLSIPFPTWSYSRVTSPISMVRGQPFSIWDCHGKEVEGERCFMIDLFVTLTQNNYTVVLSL